MLQPLLAQEGPFLAAVAVHKEDDAHTPSAALGASTGSVRGVPMITYAGKPGATAGIGTSAT